MSRRFFSLCFGVLAASVMTARADEIRRVTLDGKEGAASPVAVGDRPDAAHIRQVLTPVLEIFPGATKPTHGTILVSPGGGYRELAVDHEGRNVAKLLNDAGWDAGVLLYHVNAGPDTRALALDDAQKALTLLQTRGGEFGLSTAVVGAMGFSAGGHLTVRLAHQAAATGKPPAFLVLMYPAYLEKDGKLLDEAAPLNLPTFLYVGDRDKSYAPSSAAYAAACREKGIRCEYTVAPGVGHGFGLSANLPEGARDWPDKLKAFLASVP